MSEAASVKRCANCGGSDFFLEEASGKLRCKNCKSYYEDFSANAADNLNELRGEHITERASQINGSKDELISLACSSCGAEVTIIASEANNAKCHWCRHVLSIEDKLPNSVAPDLVLPFSIKKEVALQKVKTFLAENKVLAKNVWRRTKVSDIHGVYLPFMLVDANVHVSMDGGGKILEKTRTIGTGDNQRTVLDVGTYIVKRDFDMVVDDLAVEAAVKTSDEMRASTSNVLNAVLPFDTENAVKWDARYLRGYTMETRNVSAKESEGRVRRQIEDIAWGKVKPDMARYKYGLDWHKNTMTQRGIRWKTIHLPVWIYSVRVREGLKNKIYYVAVNGRTGETEGVIPQSRLKEWSIIIGVWLLLHGVLWLTYEFVPLPSDKLGILMTIILIVILAWVVLAFKWMRDWRSKFFHTFVKHDHAHESNVELRNIVAEDDFKGIITLETSTLGNSGAGEEFVSFKWSEEK